MCNFITATLPAGCDTPQFRAVVETHGLGFMPIENPHIQSQLRPGELYLHATRAICDCISGLSQPPAPASSDREVRKLRKKGWSEAKIQSWLQTQGPRPSPQRSSRSEGALSHGEWVAFLEAALSPRGLPYLGLLQHMYRTNTQEEDFTITREKRLLSEMIERTIPWRPNVLYELAVG